MSRKDEFEDRSISDRKCVLVVDKILVAPFHNAGIAQLGEQQTEVLEVACSIHALGISFACRADEKTGRTFEP